MRNRPSPAPSQFWGICRIQPAIFHLPPPPPSVSLPLRNSSAPLSGWITSHFISSAVLTSSPTCLSSSAMRKRDDRTLDCARVLALSHELVFVCDGRLFKTHYGANISSCLSGFGMRQVAYDSLSLFPILKHTHTYSGGKERDRQRQWRVEARAGETQSRTRIGYTRCGQIRARVTWGRVRVEYILSILSISIASHVCNLFL